MNLLIALMGGSYENVEERGSEEGLRKRAELIVKYETLMTAADRHDDQLFPKWLHFFKPEDSPDDNDSDGEAFGGVQIRPSTLRICIPA